MADDDTDDKKRAHHGRAGVGEGTGRRLRALFASAKARSILGDVVAGPATSSGTAKTLFLAAPTDDDGKPCPMCGVTGWINPRSHDRQHVLFARHGDEWEALDVTMLACKNCGFVRYHVKGDDGS